jgi:RimJ/RimL family protein N-acetyltransferase
MKVQEINDSQRPRLQKYLERDVIPNTYLLWGLQDTSGTTKFYTTSDEKDDITGTLMVRRGPRRSFSWLIADTGDAAAELSNKISAVPGLLWTMQKFGKILEELSMAGLNSWKIDSQTPFDVMKLDYSKLKLNIVHPWRQLTASDAYEWAKANLMMDSEESGDPVLEVPSREPTSEEIESSKGFLDRAKAFGIFDDENLLAARAATEDLRVAVAIRRVFTNSKYRNRGYARSITSVAVQEAVRINPENVFLFVRDENSGAKKVYEKIGFKSVAKRTEYDLVPRKG